MPRFPPHVYDIAVSVTCGPVSLARYHSSRVCAELRWLDPLRSNGLPMLPVAFRPQPDAGSHHD